MENSDTDVRSNVERRLQAIQTLSPSDPRMNGWINKSLFRIVFGEGIVPAALPLGPWLELRESTLCSAPGGYEEQMSCLLPSSSRLKAAHTSLKRTSWKAEPQKLLELFCTSIFRRQLAGLKRFEGRADLLQARSAAASGVSSQCSVTRAEFMVSVSRCSDSAPQSAKFAEDPFGFLQETSPLFHSESFCFTFINFFKLTDLEQNSPQAS